MKAAMSHAVVQRSVQRSVQRPFIGVARAYAVSVLRLQGSGATAGCVCELKGQICLGATDCDGVSDLTRQLIPRSTQIKEKKTTKMPQDSHQM